MKNPWSVELPPTAHSNQGDEQHIQIYVNEISKHFPPSSVLRAGAHHEDRSPSGGSDGRSLLTSMKCKTCLARLYSCAASEATDEGNSDERNSASYISSLSRDPSPFR